MIVLIRFLEAIVALIVWIKKAVEHFKWCLMDHNSRIREDNCEESNANYDEPNSGFSEKNVCKWPRDYSFIILVNNRTIF